MQQLEMTNVFVCEISQDRSSEKTPFEQSIFITTINVKNNHTHVQNGAMHMALDTTVPPPTIVAVAGNDLRF